MINIPSAEVANYAKGKYGHCLDRKTLLYIHVLRELDSATQYGFDKIVINFINEEYTAEISKTLRDKGYRVEETKMSGDRYRSLKVSWGDKDLC